MMTSASPAPLGYGSPAFAHGLSATSPALSYSGGGVGIGIAAAPSPATAFLQHGSGTPGPSTTALLMQQSRPGAMSQAGSAISSSLLATSADAPNEARKLIHMMLEEGQGRLSLARVAAEIAAVQADVYVGRPFTSGYASNTSARMSRNNAFYASNLQYDPVARLRDLLATLDELQIQLARTGLGALKLGQYSSANVQYDISSLANEVQSSFRHRQRVRDGSGVARSILK